MEQIVRDARTEILWQINAQKPVEQNFVNDEIVLEISDI